MKPGPTIRCLLAAWALVATLMPVDRTAAGERTALGGSEAPVIAALRANGATILTLGNRGGLDGHFVELADGDAYGLYLTPDGHAVAGLLYAPDGSLVTGRQIAFARNAAASESVATRSVSQSTGSVETIEAGSQLDRPPLGEPTRLAHLQGDGGYVPEIDRLFEGSLSAFGFTLGRTGPRAVVFADPACRWSHSAVVQLGRAAIDGRLRLRVVPVGLLGAVSAREAAAIASAPDPALEWFERGGVQATAEGAKRIEVNNALYERWDADVVPLIAWRGADARVGYRLGDLDDPDAWLEALGHE